MISYMRGNLGCCAPPNRPTNVIILITYYLLLITCYRDLPHANREKDTRKKGGMLNFALRKSKTCTALKSDEHYFLSTKRYAILHSENK